MSRPPVLQEDLDTIDRLTDNAEATYNKFRHPDPYIGQFILPACYNNDPYSKGDGHTRTHLHFAL